MKFRNETTITKLANNEIFVMGTNPISHFAKTVHFIVQNKKQKTINYILDFFIFLF